MDTYLSNVKARNKIRRTHYVNLNKLVWKYFEDCKLDGTKLNGKMLKEQAMRYATVLGLESFRGSEGWLDAFKRRHKIDLRTMSGESVCYENDFVNGESMDMSSQMIDNINQQVELINDNNDKHNSNQQSPFLADEMTAYQFLEAFGNAALCNTNNMDMRMLNDSPRMADTSTSSTTPTFMTGQNNLKIENDNVNVNKPSTSGQPFYTANENSTISSIVKSCALRVPSPEVTFALDTIRSFILANDPSAMDSLVQLQQKIVEIDKMKSSSSSSSPSNC